jgi:hypothetical protein
MPAGDVFGLDGFFLNKSNPITVSTIGINSTGVGAGITVVSGVLNTTAGIATLTLSTAAGLSTTPFYVGAKIAVSGITNSTGVAFPGYNGTFVVTGFAGTTTVSYATTGYVGSVTAGITTTGRVMLVTDTTVTNTTWSSAQTHGWFSGGSSVSTVDRIDFSNDTATANIRGSLSELRYLLSATGNSNYGWFGGGISLTPAFSSRVDRIDFANDSGTASVRGPLSHLETAYGGAATGNSNYGWFGGGGFSESTKVDRIDFSNDSGTALPKGQLTYSRGYLAATGNSNYGWFGGGQTYYQFSPGPFIYADVNRIDFSNDLTTASIRGSLSAARGYKPAATGNSNYGWFGGGATPNAPRTAYSIVDRIDFSNDSNAASPRGPLSSAKYFLTATGNSNYGWFGGGPGTATVDRIDFSNDSVTASPRGPLSTTKNQLAATSGQARSSSVRLQKAGNYGWFGGGGTPRVSRVDRIDFSNDSSTASPRGLLSSERYSLAATGNSNYGWFGGGSTSPARVSTVDRIDFANDSATVSIRGPLIQGRQFLAATGNSNYGWFGGGQSAIGDRNSPYYSIVDRINFSNDSTTASVRGLLSLERYALAATGNSNYGWFCGGTTSDSKSSPGINTNDRIDFSNDSVSASPRGALLITARQSFAATGNSNYGWFGGGTNPILATVERMDFSNDLSSTSPRGALSQPIYVLAATGNSNYGWFGGGNIGPAPLTGTTITNVYRINFSNDSVTTVGRGGLSLDRERLAATSNSTR